MIFFFCFLATPIPQILSPPAAPPTFVPSLSRASSDTNETSSSYSEFNYYREVKQRLKSKYLYHQFLSAISLFSQGIITKAELMYLTHGILIKHRDLYESFKTFIGFHEIDGKESCFLFFVFLNNLSYIFFRFLW